MTPMYLIQTLPCVRLTADRDGDTLILKPTRNCKAFDQHTPWISKAV